MERLTAMNLFLALPVLFVELATLLNLFGYYSYHEQALAAMLLALSYSVLLVASAILISQDLNGTIRFLVVVGASLLFLVQGASNISEAYLRARDVLPADLLGRLWGTTGPEWLVHSSFI